MRKKFFIVLVIVVCFCLNACSDRSVSSTDNKPTSNENISVSEPSIELPEESGSNSSTTQEDLLSKETLDQIGKTAVEKWKNTGHIFSTPLYNTDFSQLGQDELRKIYSVYIFTNHLDDTLVSEQLAENGATYFWMDFDNLKQFAQDYFGLNFDNQEHNLPDDCIVGDEIQFYFNSRFNVLPSELSPFDLVNCIQNLNKTFIANISAKQFDNPNSRNIIQEFDLSLAFQIKDDCIIFLRASLI